MKTKYIKLNTKYPPRIIKYINLNYPELHGLCYYDEQLKELKSNNIDIAEFYFDQYHTVLKIIIK